MKNDQSLETAAATVMTGCESDENLEASIDEKLGWILDLGSTYHLCSDTEMFFTYATCDDRLVWMTNNITSRVIGK